MGKHSLQDEFSELRQLTRKLRGELERMIERCEALSETQSTRKAADASEDPDRRPSENEAEIQSLRRELEALAAQAHQGAARLSTPSPASASSETPDRLDPEERQRLLAEITHLRESLLARDRTPLWKLKDQAEQHPSETASTAHSNRTPAPEAPSPSRPAHGEANADSNPLFFHIRPNAVRAAGSGGRQPRLQTLRENAPLPQAAFRQTHGGRVSLWRLLWDRGFLLVRQGAEPPPLKGAFGASGKRKIVFVGHDASRTGAPLVLLYLMRDMAKLPDVELFVFLDRDGPLVEEFNRVAHVIVNDRDVLFSYSDLSIPALLKATAKPLPTVAICNSAEVWRFLPEMKHEQPMTRLSLIDERLTHYPPETHAAILEYSDAMVFPSEAMRQVAIGIDARFESSRVIPHGLMRPEFGVSDRAAAREALRSELEIPQDALIVMGCGTVDRRKGSDLFVLVAHGVQQAWGGPAHFLWLGGALGGMAAYDQKKWILHDIKMFGLEGRVHFLDARPDPEPCFMGADIFLLTSRDDPFPCVIHEAMAAALPIVCFDKAGGTPEALVDGCGRVVPYLDVEAMAKEVIDLLENAASRAEIGCRAEARVRSIYRSEDFSARIVELADQMISSDDATVPRS